MTLKESLTPKQPLELSGLSLQQKLVLISLLQLQLLMMQMLLVGLSANLLNLLSQKNAMVLLLFKDLLLVTQPIMLINIEST